MTLPLKKTAIKEIIIGPKYPEEKKTIEELLAKCNLHCTIRYSAGHGIYVDSENQRRNDSK